MLMHYHCRDDWLDRPRDIEAFQSRPMFGPRPLRHKQAQHDYLYSGKDVCIFGGWTARYAQGNLAGHVKLTKKSKKRENGISICRRLEWVKDLADD